MIKSFMILDLLLLEDSRIGETSGEIQYAA